MPLTIDLLHEHHQQELERRTDPLRIGILGLLVVTMILVSFYMFKSASYKNLKNEQTRLQSLWASKEPLLQASLTEEETYRSEIDTAKELVRRAEGRPYWGPLLEQILRSIPKEVQIQTLAGQSEREARRFSLSLAGLCAGRQPRQSAEDFRQALLQRLETYYGQASVEFPTDLEDMPTQVVLDGNNFSTVRFTLTVKVELKALESPEE